MGKWYEFFVFETYCQNFKWKTVVCGAVECVLIAVCTHTIQTET